MPREEAPLVLASGILGCLDMLVFPFIAACGYPARGARSGPLCQRPRFRLLQRHYYHSPWNWLTFAAVILGMGIIVRFSAGGFPATIPKAISSPCWASAEGDWFMVP